MFYRELIESDKLAHEALKDLDIDLAKALNLFIATSHYNDEVYPDHVILFIKVSPFLEIYPGTKTKFPEMLIEIILDSERSYVRCINSPKESHFDMLLNEVNDSSKIYKILNRIPASHPHVSSDCSPCFGEGTGIYCLIHQNFNTASLIQNVLDLRQWANSVNLSGAFWIPNLYMQKIFYDTLNNYPHSSTHASLFEDQETLMNLMSYCRSGESNMTSQLIEYLKGRIEITSCSEEEHPSTIKSIKMSDDITNDKIRALYLISEIALSDIHIESIGGSICNDGGGVNNKISRKIDEVLGRENGDYSYIFREILLNNALHRTCLDGVFSIGEYSSLYDGYGINTIDFNSDLSIINSLFNKDNNDVVVNKLATTYLRYQLESFKRTAFIYNAKKETLNDQLRNFQEHGGKDRLLPQGV